MRKAETKRNKSPVDKTFFRVARWREERKDEKSHYAAGKHLLPKGEDRRERVRRSDIGRPLERQSYPIVKISQNGPQDKKGKRQVGQNLARENGLAAKGLDLGSFEPGFEPLSVHLHPKISLNPKPSVNKSKKYECMNVSNDLRFRTICPKLYEKSVCNSVCEKKQLDNQNEGKNKNQFCLGNMCECMSEDLCCVNALHESHSCQHRMFAIIPLEIQPGFVIEALIDSMIDSGASHNFIDTHIANTLQLTPITKHPLNLTLANCTKAKVDNAYQCLFRFHEMDFHITCYEMEMNFDVILGIPWLRKYAPYVQWDEMTISFPRVSSKTYALGESSENLFNFISAKQLHKLFKRKEVAWCINVKVDNNKEPMMSQVSELPEIFHKDTHLMHLYEKYRVIFQKELDIVDDKPINPALTHKIELKPHDGIPVRPYYRMSVEEEGELRKQIDTYLRLKQIRPSHSQYAAPVLFVKKKDGRFRMCVDYRLLNKYTVRNQYPLPRIDELIDSLQGSHYFTKLDLTSGYHQIRIVEDDVHKTAFRCKLGHYEFRVMPFGLCNAPVTFQNVMNNVLHEYLYKFCIVYLDDILIYSKNLEEHYQHLDKVFEKLHDAGLRMNVKKCTFCVNEVEYLGFVINEQGCMPQDSHVQDLLKWKPPFTTKKQVRSFHGLASYYRKFIPRFARIAQPLTDLMGDDTKEIVWSEEATQAVQELQQALTSQPILKLPDTDKDFFVYTDASRSTIGAVLTQEHANDKGKMVKHPVAYLSRKLSTAEMNPKLYSVYEKEFLAIVHALKKWRHYLLGRHFTIYTDHEPLVYLMKQTDLNNRQAKWIDFQIGRAHV